MSIKALERHLEPLTPYLEMNGVTEICINQPREIYVEKDSLFTRYEINELTYDFLQTLAMLIAEFNQKDFPVPLLSGSLPSGERIQIVMNPACERDKFVCSIRRPQMKSMTLDDYSAVGAFDELKIKDKSKEKMEIVLRELYLDGNPQSFLELALKAKKNILISGGTGTGKTTFLNACLKDIPMHERLITIEDTREVVIEQPNAAHLLFNEEDQRISALNMFKACLRLRPDRIFLSELRGAEVWPYLRAANSGHSGTLSTVHADSPEAAFNQLVFMMQQAGSTSSDERIREYVKSIINIVIQLKRDPRIERYMYVSSVYFDAVQ